MSQTEARNRFAELRATLRLPVVCAPMFLVSGPDLVTRLPAQITEPIRCTA